MAFFSCFRHEELKDTETLPLQSRQGDEGIIGRVGLALEREFAVAARDRQGSDKISHAMRAGTGRAVSNWTLVIRRRSSMKSSELDEPLQAMGPLLGRNDRAALITAGASTRSEE